MARTDRLRARAAAAGERWCGIGHHQVSVEACTNPNGEIMASCVDCRQRRRNERAAAAAEAEVLARAAADNLAPDIDDALLGPAEGIEDGLGVDDEFGDAQWMMDINLPDDSAVTVTEKARLDNFRRELKRIQLQDCTTCREHGFVTGTPRNRRECARFAADKDKKWSDENNVNPGMLLAPTVTGPDSPNRKCPPMSPRTYRSRGNAYSTNKTNHASPLH